MGTDAATEAKPDHDQAPQHLPHHHTHHVPKGNVTKTEEVHIENTPRAETETLVGLTDFVDAFTSYTAVANFRDLSHGGHAPKHIPIAVPAYDQLAEGVRAVIIRYIADVVVNRTKLALDLWGSLRSSVAGAIAEAKRHGISTAGAEGGFERLENYLIDTAATTAIKRGQDSVTATIGVDSGMRQAEFDAMRAAYEAMEEFNKESSLLGTTVSITKDVPQFGLFSAIVGATTSLKEAVELWHRGETGGAAASGGEFLLHGGFALSHALKLADRFLPGLASHSKKAAEMFASLLGREHHFGAVGEAGEHLGRFLSVVEVTVGLTEILVAALKGDGDMALDGLQKVLVGGGSLLMAGVGTGALEAAGPAFLAVMFVATVRECLRVGGLWKAVAHNQEVVAVGTFVSVAAKYGEGAAGAFAALAERYADTKHSNDPRLQAEVQAQIEIRMKDQAADLAAGLQAALGPMLESSGNVHAIGHYRDAMATLGPQALGALNYIVTKGRSADPATVAYSCVTLFEGIARVGQWIIDAHGVQREQPESVERTKERDDETTKEWQGVGYDLSAKDIEQ